MKKKMKKCVMLGAAIGLSLLFAKNTKVSAEEQKTYTDITKLSIEDAVTYDFDEDDNYSEGEGYIYIDFSSPLRYYPNANTLEARADNKYYTAKDGLLYSKDMKCLKYCPPAKEGDIVIPEGVEKISDTAFQGCTKITSVTIPSTVKKIGLAAFGYNSSLKVLKVSKNNKKYSSKDNVLFDKNKTKLIAYAGGKPETQYQIPDGVVSIEATSFKGNMNLQKIKIPGTVGAIMYEAFCDCFNLKKIEFTKGLEYIYPGAFYKCKALKSVKLPEGLLILTEKNFEKCDNLKKISLPFTLCYVENGEIFYKKNRTVIVKNPLMKQDLEKHKEKSKIITYRGYELSNKFKKYGFEIKYFKKEFLNKTTKINKGVSGTGKINTRWYHKNRKVFYITNPDQLAGLKKLISKNISFKGKKIFLQNDLDMTCYKDWGNMYGGVFEGTLDGKGHTIYNLTSIETKVENFDEEIEDDTSYALIETNDGTIENLNIKGANIIADLNGALISNLNTGVIKNCSVSGTVYGCYAGGLVKTNGGIIMNCKSSARVKGVLSAGGIAGENVGFIKNCFNSGKVKGAFAGGIFGITSKGYSISHCQNKGKIVRIINRKKSKAKFESLELYDINGL